VDPFTMLSIAIVFGVSAGMLNIWVSHRRKQQVLEQWHKERMAAMDKGLPLPELPINVLTDDTPSAMRSLRTGISFVLIGAAVYVATARALDEDLAFFGLIPSAVGVANMIHAALLWRRKPDPPR
jgi:hypothetical protein